MASITELVDTVDLIPDFELADPDPSSVRWSTGQVRGPRELPVRLLTSSES